VVSDIAPARLLDRLRAGGPRKIETFRALGALEKPELVVLQLLFGAGFGLLLFGAGFGLRRHSVPAPGRRSSVSALSRAGSVDRLRPPSLVGAAGAGPHLDRGLADSGRGRCPCAGR